MSSTNPAEDPAPPAPASAAPAETRVTLTATAEYACYGEKSERACWAITSFKAPFYEPVSRAPVDIVAVIDKSGSMSGEKIALVRETLLFVIEQCKQPHLPWACEGWGYDYCKRV